MPGPGREAFRRFRAIARPFWVSEERGIARSQLAMLLVLLVAQTAFTVLYVAQSGEFTSALAARDAERFGTVIVQCLATLALSVPVWALTTYTRDKLALRWRRWLTHRYLDAWLCDRHYYRLNTEGGIDNPDQRIAEDINALTQNSLWFLTIAVGALMQLIAFTGVLWAISPLLVGVLVVYAVMGNMVTTGVFARRLIALNFNQIRREADFRFGLVRIREHAEPIALHRGEPFELAQARRGFSALFVNLSAIIRTQLGLGFFQHGFGFFALVLPTIVVAGDVLSGRLEVGRAVEATGAFAAMLSALTIIVSYFTELSKLVAGIERLEGFAAELFGPGGRLASDRAAPVIDIAPAAHIAFEHVTLQTPGRERTLVRDLSLVVPPGAGLVIVGESGVGRTSLLRAVAGLWSAGSGRIARPRPQHVVYVPQQPYLAPGTLRDQVLYPEATREVSDAELLEVLRRVNLADLAARAGGLDRERDWAKLLSVGEQQRLAIARLLLAEPHFALLDEATSALDAADEANVYALLAAAHITPITVSHRPSLVARHEQVLELASDGGWQLRPATLVTTNAKPESGAN